MAVDEIEQLWFDYSGSRRQVHRDQLILHYAPLVKYVAGRVGGGLPRSVEQSDLVSYGMFGLIDAIEKYEPSRGFKFETYAIPRIKGAIYDELRSNDWVPRSVRAKARGVENAMRKLEAELRRTPTDEEIAAEMGMSTDELHEILGKVALGGIAALDEMLGAGDRGEGITLGDTIADQRSGPVGQVEVREMQEILAGMISDMAQREREVLTLYYYEGLTLAEIGRIIGVTESRVSQIHSRAVLQLRSRLTAADA